jgi:predicted lipoprotein with Yx(FWY)xxD motif
MKRTLILGGVLAAAVLAGGGAALDAALGGAGTPAGAAYGAPAAAAPSAAPSVPAAAGIGVAALAPGTALVDGAGRALYLFEADTGTMSTCTGACAQVWPPLLASGGMPGTSGAAQAGLMGTTARGDGTRQVTYNGHPLYYFAGDTAPGDVKGQGIDNFGGSWYVVSPVGSKIDNDDAPANPPSAGTGNGY